MTRNLNRRVEILFPVEDRRLVRDRILELYLSDTVKAREMRSDGTYVRRAPAPDEAPVNAQEELLQAARLRGDSRRGDYTTDFSGWVSACNRLMPRSQRS